MTTADSADLSVQSGGLVVSLTEGRGDAEPPVESDRVCRLVLEILVGEGITSGRLDVHLVDAADIAALNAEHLGSEGPTDVLSFPLDTDDDPPLDDEPRFLGDLVLCPVVAAAQAVEHVGSFEGEVALLVIHGVLHILGHEHGDEAKAEAMRELERFYLEPLGFAHPGPQ